MLAVLGGALLLQRRSLWYDELFTAHIGTAGPVALVRSVLSGEGTVSYLREVPPSYNAPYYVVVQAWLWLTRLPADEIGIRLLSLGAAVAGVGVLTAAVSRLAGGRAGVLAGLLAATSPMVVEYAAEGRMYGLALLATATAVLGLSRWLDDGRLGLWAVGATAAALAHWFAVPVLAGLALSALLLRRRRALPVVAVAAAVVLGVAALAAAPALAGVDGGSGAVLWRAGGATVVVLDDPWLPGVLAELRAARIDEVDVLVLRRGGRAVAGAVLELRSRVGARLVLAPEGHRVRGALVPPEGRFRVGGLVVDVTGTRPPLGLTVTRRAGATPSPAVGRHGGGEATPVSQPP